MWKIADFPIARRPVQAAGTAVPISKFHSKDLKAQRSNFVFDAAALQAIFNPQIAEIEVFSAARREKMAGTGIWSYPIKLDHQTGLCINF